MPPGTTARRVALDALVAIAQGGRANVVVPQMLQRTRLEQRDRNLVTELVYGATRMQRACDWMADVHRKGPVDEEVRCALRLGTYQIGWTRIPPHAAVSETVNEVRGRGRSVVNAVLRRVATDFTNGLVAWPDLATQLSYPDWIVDRLTRDLGRDRAVAALKKMNEAAAPSTRADGYIQDPASQMVAEHLLTATQKQALVLDVCSAPGGKTTALAGPDRTWVAASDISSPRTRMVDDNVRRLGLQNVSVLVADARWAPYRGEVADVVLVDAPCSGLGVLRRRADARWRIKPEDVKRLVVLQKHMLTEAKRLVKVGGVIAYSVCTLTGAETADIDRWLLEEAPDLEPLPPPGPPWEPAGRGGLLLPQAAGTDGMFLLALRRTRGTSRTTRTRQ